MRMGNCTGDYLSLKPPYFRIKSWDWGNVLMGYGLLSCTLQVCSAIENNSRGLLDSHSLCYLVSYIWSSFMNYILFSGCVTRKYIYNNSCDRQQKWICAQVPWKGAEEDCHGRHRDDLQLSRSLASGHRSDHHMVSGCYRYVWLGGLQKLFR